MAADAKLFPLSRMKSPLSAEVLQHPLVLSMKINTFIVQFKKGGGIVASGAGGKFEEFLQVGAFWVGTRGLPSVQGLS